MISSLIIRHSAGLYKPPHRRRGCAQLTSDEVKSTMIVANMRIHVERDMRRAREFNLLNKRVPISHADLNELEVFAAFFMGNFQAPLTARDFFE